MVGESENQVNHRLLKAVIIAMSPLLKLKGFLFAWHNFKRIKSICYIKSICVNYIDL